MAILSANGLKTNYMNNSLSRPRQKYLSLCLYLFEHVKDTLIRTFFFPFPIGGTALKGCISSEVASSSIQEEAKQNLDSN